ncbi:MAG: response regulator transcription factor [Armatimonadetes bacterium]|nr:response regulator transcription factor [Armatimonadota bacterium]
MVSTMQGLGSSKQAHPIRVLLADDHPVVRVGVKAVLDFTGENITVAGEVSNGLEVLEFARNNSVDIYVLDIAMPEMNGLLTTQKLLQIDPTTKVVILSIYTDKVLVRSAFRSGARGYVVKATTTDDIIRAITEVYQGRVFVSPSVAEYLLEEFTQPTSDDASRAGTDALTNRQKEVLTLLCEGLTEKEIAYRLQLSYNTVHTHKHTLMKRLDLHSTAELVKYGIRTGLVAVGPDLPSGAE